MLNSQRQKWDYAVRHIEKRSITYYNKKKIRGQKKIKKWFIHIKSLFIKLLKGEQ